MADLNILRGAAFAAEAKRKGLSLEQAVDLVMADMPGEVDGLSEISNREVQFGEFGNQDELQNFGGGVDARGKPAFDYGLKLEEEGKAFSGNSDPNQLTRTYFEKGSKVPKKETIYIRDGMPVPERFQDAAKYRDFGLARKDVPAPSRQVMQQALNDVNMGIDQFGSEAFGSVPAPQRGVLPDSQGGGSYEPERVTLASVAGRLEDNIRPNNDAQTSLVSELVRRDAAMQNPIAQMINDARAAREADDIAYKFFANDARGGSRADRALENLGVIGKIGHAKIATDFGVNRYPVDRGDGLSLPVNLPEQYNAPVTDNRFAGPLQKQQQFVVDNIPGMVAMERTGNFPQVSINEQLAAARQALGQAKFKGQAADLGGVQIRNLDELQAAADMVAGLAKEKGQTMFERVDGNNVPIADPGIRAALERGGMNAREVGNVAAAMFQIEAARRNELNQTRKELFGAGLGQPGRPVDFGGNHPALGGGAAEIARLRGEKIEGKEVKAQLQALDGKGGGLNAAELKQARMPFIGAVAGEGAPRAAFVRGQDRGLSRQSLIAKYGAVNGEVAARLNERAGQMTGNQADGFGQPKTGFAAGLQPNEDQRGPRRIGNDIKNQLAELNSGAYQGNPTRPLTDELRGELSALGGGQFPPGGGRGSQRYMSTPDGPNNQGKGFAARAGRPFDGVRERFSRAGRNQKTAAVVGGAVLGTLGLDALIGGESNRRKEEGQY